MDDKTLHDNYYNLVCQYIKQKKAEVDDEKFHIQNDGTLTGFSFRHWDYDFSVPIIDDLRKIDLKKMKKRIEGNKVQCVDLDDIEPEEGLIIFDEKTKKLRIYNKGKWY